MAFVLLMNKGKGEGKNKKQHFWANVTRRFGFFQVG